MSIKIADRVKETSLTQGVGTLTLNGAFGGFQSFSSAIGDGNSTYYAIENESRWEVGIGTYTSSSNTLSRDTVLKSSSGTSKITISGVAVVFCSYPADKAVVRDENGDISESGILTLIRDSAGNFFHAYKDDSYDRTISLYTDGNASPEWKLGVKNSPSSETEAPSEGYVYGKDGQVGLVGNSSNSITLDNTTNFTVKHNSFSLIKASASTGIHFNTNSPASPAVTINGAAGQSQPLTEWTDSAGNVLSIVDKDGNIGVNRSSADYELDVTGSGRFTSVIFADATEQSTAYTNQEVAVSGWAEAYVDSQDHSAAAVSGWADSTMTTRDTAISGWAKSYVDNQDHSGGGGSAADILANSASGVVISGIANTNSINIASNLVEIRANSASGVVISGIANTNIASISTNATNIASNLVEIRANSASGVVISGIANANVTNIATNAADIIVVSGIAEAGGGGSAADILVVSGIANANAVAIDASGTYWLSEIRANSASGVVISGIANTNVTNIASNLVEIRANSASGVVISGIANTNVTNIATNVTDIATNAADIIVVSGIANTNVTNIASNLVEIRANSASGVVISGIADTAYGWGNHSLQSYSTSDTTYTPGSGLELHGTAFQAAISGANLLATNTPTDNYIPSYDTATGKFTWVANAGGGGASYTAGSGLVLDGDNKFHSTFASGNYLLGEIRDNSSSGVVISGIANTNVTNIATNVTDIATNAADIIVVSGIANTNVSNIASNLVEIRANSASGVVISGIANTNVTNIATNVTDIATNAADIIVVSGIANTNVSNIASNLVEIRANSASGVVISGIANTNVTNIATNVTDIATNAADIIVVSGIANTNVSNIASNLVEIRANSASGVVISGIANTNVTNIATNVTDIATNAADIIVVSGIANTAYGWGDHSLQSYSAIDWTSSSAGTIHATNYTNTTYSVEDGGLTTNDFTTADHSKLDGIETSATADQTQAEINALEITKVGTVATGVWQGTAVGSSYIADAFLKNDADDTTTGTVTAGGFSTAGSVTSNGYKMSSGGYTDIVGTSHTLAAADNGKVLLFTNASAITLTVPSGLTSGHSCTVIQVSGGQIAFDNNSGATEIRNRQSHTKTAGRDARVGLVQYQPDKYNLGGDTAS